MKDEPLHHEESQDRVFRVRRRTRSSTGVVAPTDPLPDLYEAAGVRGHGDLSRSATILFVTSGNQNDGALLARLCFFGAAEHYNTITKQMYA